MAISREEVVSVLGAVEDELLAAIVATGASAGELVQAQTGLAADEALIGEERPLPSGRVAELVGLLDSDSEEDGAGPSDESRP